MPVLRNDYINAQGGGDLRARFSAVPFGRSIRQYVQCFGVSTQGIDKKTERCRVNV